MIDFDGDWTPVQLVGGLTEQLADAEAAVVREGDGWAVLRNGMVLDWTSRLGRPSRRSGHVVLDDPESFVAYVQRSATDDTLLYASIADTNITAVLNDHPETDGGTDASDVRAGRRDDIAVLQLRPAEDWTTIVRNSGRVMPQQEFAELIEEIAHTVTSPDSATMLEVASTLNVKQNIDFGSRVRTQSGDVEFRFEQTSDARAGRTERIEIPTKIAFATNPWVGTPGVTVEARLRFRASAGGCVMGYRLIRLGEALEGAFRDIVVDINEQGAAPSVLFGNASVGRRPL